MMDWDIKSMVGTWQLYSIFEKQLAYQSLLIKFGSFHTEIDWRVSRVIIKCSKDGKWEYGWVTVTRSVLYWTYPIFFWVSMS